MNKQNHNNKNKSKPKSKREIVEIKKERFEGAREVDPIANTVRTAVSF